MLRIGATLLTAAFWLTLASGATAQEAVGGALICDSQELSLDGIGSTSVSASEARRIQIERLHAVVHAASVACAADRKLRGCGALERFLDLRNLGGAAWSSEPNDDAFAQRTQQLAADHLLDIEARRVLAFKECAAQAAQSRSSLDCVALADAETRSGALVEAAAPSKTDAPTVDAGGTSGHDSAPTDSRTTRERLLDSELLKAIRSRQKGSSSLASDVVAAVKSGPEKAILQSDPSVTTTTPADTHKALKAFLDVVANPPACQKSTKDPNCVSTRSDWAKFAIEIEAVAKYNLANHSYVPTSELASKEVARLVRRVFRTELGRRPMDCSPAGRTSPGFSTAYCAEYVRQEAWASECSQATIYVSPTGTVVDRGSSPAPPSICIAASNYSIDRPFDVRVATSQQRTILRAWPSEPRRLTLPSEGVAHLEVRGFPRGDALRALARASGGASSKLLESGQSGEELAAEAQRLRSQRQALEDDARTAASLRTLASRVELDPRWTAAASKISAALTGPKNDATTKAIQDALPAGVDALKTLIEEAIARKDGAELDGRAVQVAFVNRPFVPSDLTADAAREAGTSVAQFPSTLRAKATSFTNDPADNALTASEKDSRRRLMRLCQLANFAAKVAVEDVVRGEENRVAILDYEFSAGLLSSPPRINERQKIFVRVSGVPAGNAVRVELNDTGIVQYAPKVVGGTAADLPKPGGAGAGAYPKLDASSTRTEESELFDDLETRSQIPSTQIVPLGELTGGNQYTLAVCAQKGASLAQCDSTGQAGADKARLLGKHTLLVHGERYLGVRAGLGMVTTYADATQIVPVDASQANGSNGQYVRVKNVRNSFSVPILMAWYPGGRDALGGPPPHNFALVTGVDAASIAQPAKIFPLGAVYEFRGFGLTAAFSVENVSYDIARPESYLPASAGGVKSDTRWRPGALFSITTDLDIFETIFRRYFLDKANPKIGGGS